MSLLRGAFLTVCIALMCSCRTMPPLEPVQAARVLSLVEASQPESFKAQQVLVFAFKPHWWWPTIRMTALGYAVVNRKAGEYAVVCLSPMGVKIFEAKRCEGVATVTMAFPVKGDTGAMGKAIGADIESLYLGRIPPSNAIWRQRGGELTATLDSGDRHEEWWFAADTVRLFKKTVRTPAGTRTLTFDDYKPFAGGMCPGHMMLRNDRFRYSLTVQQSQL